MIDEASTMSTIARRSIGITKTLPRTIQDAWKLLLEDKELVRELGENFVQKYLSVKQVRRFL